MGFWLSWESCAGPRSRLQPLETWGLPLLSRRSSLVAAAETILRPRVSDGMVPVQRGTGSPTPVTYLESAPGNSSQGSAVAVTGSGAATV